MENIGALLTINMPLISNHRAHRTLLYANRKSNFRNLVYTLCLIYSSNYIIFIQKLNKALSLTMHQKFIKCSLSYFHLKDNQKKKEEKCLVRSEVSIKNKLLQHLTFIMELTWTAVFPITQANLIPGNFVYSSLRALI